MIKQIIAGVAAVISLYAGAFAEPSKSKHEFRLGVLAHDVALVTSGSGGVEDGPNLAIEGLLASPGFFKWIGSPRPYANFSWNLGGDTNFGGVGLAWQTPAWRNRVFGEFGLGVNWHDGVVDLPEQRDDPVRLRLNDTRVLLGSREVFRTTLAAGYRVTDDWDVTIVYEHLSHGQILGTDRNQGLDNIGVRLGRRFGGW